MVEAQWIPSAPIATPKVPMVSTYTPRTEGDVAEHLGATEFSANAAPMKITVTHRITEWLAGFRFQLNQLCRSVVTYRRRPCRRSRRSRAGPPRRSNRSTIRSPGRPCTCRTGRGRPRPGSGSPGYPKTIATKSMKIRDERDHPDVRRPTGARSDLHEQRVDADDRRRVRERDREVVEKSDSTLDNSWR